MRLLFAASLAVALIGSVITGGALAWENTVVVSREVSVGDVQFTVSYVRYFYGVAVPEGTEQRMDAAPGGGMELGNVGIDNTGDLNLELVINDLNGSRVIMTGVTPAGPELCSISNFSGRIEDLNAGILVPNPHPGIPVPNVARIIIAVSPAAPPACAGAFVSYDIVITMTATRDITRRG